MKNQNGLTIVELLAAITISTIVLIMIFALVNQSQAEHSIQMENSKELSKNTFVLKQITKDIRESIDLKEIADVIILSKPNGNDTTYKFDAANNILERDDVPIANDLKSFKLNVNENENSVKIQLENLRDELLTTTIYIRGD